MEDEESAEPVSSGPPRAPCQACSSSGLYAAVVESHSNPAQSVRRKEVMGQALFSSFGKREVATPARVTGRIQSQAASETEEWSRKENATSPPCHHPEATAQGATQPPGTRQETRESAPQPS
ncbi:hypothetical protein U0070_026774 [Myodes glareolus]|uniref:Uncharacterized protein n=1 Tax=Myodes glareolus TaxID=447135 RepID=A0AAW0I6U1_MYOGA